MSVFALIALLAAQPAPTPPKPPAPPAIPTPSDVIAASTAADWEDIDPADLMIFDFDGGRRAVVQLAPAFAPDHIANIKLIARSGHWKQATIYRVADNWVTQWGAGEDEQERSPPLPKGAEERPDEEYSRPATGLSVLPSGSVDPYSQMSGFAGGWPVAVHADGRVNLAFCYGTVGVARGPAPDTGSGSELFAIIGTPSRRLDRNFTAVGRWSAASSICLRCHAAPRRSASTPPTRQRFRLSPSASHPNCQSRSVRASKS